MVAGVLTGEPGSVGESVALALPSTRAAAAFRVERRSLHELDKHAAPKPHA